jgi:hypothetical protein
VGATGRTSLGGSMEAEKIIKWGVALIVLYWLVTWVLGRFSDGLETASYTGIVQPQMAYVVTPQILTGGVANWNYWAGTAGPGKYYQGNPAYYTYGNGGRRRG